VARGAEGALDLRFPQYYIFGERGSKVDVACVLGDIVCGVTRDDAARIIEQRDKVREFILSLEDEIGNKRLAELLYAFHSK
jgi:hypothetical protein